MVPWGVVDVLVDVEVEVVQLEMEVVPQQQVFDLQVTVLPLLPDSSTSLLASEVLLVEQNQSFPKSQDSAPKVSAVNTDKKVVGHTFLGIGGGRPCCCRICRWT